MPGWLQGLAQVFPVCWLGLGSARLPAGLDMFTPKKNLSHQAFFYAR
jgi:hypothetical protein